MGEDDKYDVLDKIGHGSFGIIRRVKRKADGLILCRKEISYHRMSQKEREQLQAELSILKELRHPNIVKYYERNHMKESQDLHLYMEYCGNGDLGQVIKNLSHKKEFAQEEFVWSICSQITSALYRCHNGEDPPPAGSNALGLAGEAKGRPGQGKPMILHRDLKPENIFLDHDNSVKLGDFGLSKILQSHDFASTYVGTPFYMSPEICKAESYTCYSDIWALGCIIYEMCTKTPPFNAKTHFDLIQKIKLGRFEEIPDCYSPDLKNFVRSCLQVIPTRRPNTAEILNLPIIKLMRKEQEVVQTGKDMLEQKEMWRLKTEAAELKIAEFEAMRRDLDNSLRREWEVKAALTIKEQVQQRIAEELVKLQQQFEVEVNKRVEKALARYPSRLSTSPRLAPRSSTPTMPAEQEALFPTEHNVINTSMSTLGVDSSFASGTDISSLSLDSPLDEPKPKPVAARRTNRQPLSRAKTYAAAAPLSSLPPPSPMDIQMAEPSPAPASLAGLSLSPRRNVARQNIFAAARQGTRKLDLDIPPSPTEEDWDEDDVPVLPSPTRARSASGGRHNNEDPFKVLAAGQRPILKPNQRLASTPSLVPGQLNAKPRPVSTVPTVSTSPTRQNKTRSVDLSPTRRTTTVANPSTTGSGGGLKSKKGNEQMRIQAMRNHGGIQGRTIVQLNHEKRNPAPGLLVPSQQTQSEDEGRRTPGAGVMRTGFRSPMKARSANALVADGDNGPAVWDPDTTEEMPSPFLVRNKRII